MKLFVGYSKAPEQPQSSARPMCQSHTMMSTGHEPAAIRIAAYRSSLRYTFNTPREKTSSGIVITRDLTRELKCVHLLQELTSMGFQNI